MYESLFKFFKSQNFENTFSREQNELLGTASVPIGSNRAIFLLKVDIERSKSDIFGRF